MTTVTVSERAILAASEIERASWLPDDHPTCLRIAALEAEIREECAAADAREIALLAELSGLDQMNITLAALVRRAMKLIPEGKSLWWDEAKAALDLIDEAAAIRQKGQP